MFYINIEHNQMDFELHDISISDIIPMGDIFKKGGFIEKLNVKSDYKVTTNENFYNNGIIGNLIKEKKNKLQKPKFSKFCNHNWLVSYIIMKRFSFSRFSEIKILNIGNSNNGFMAGIYYFILENNIKIKWFVVDKKNNMKNKCYETFYKYLYHNKIDIKNHVIHDYPDFENYSDFVNIISLTETRFNKVHFLYNNIQPKTKVLILFAIASIKLLHNDGIFITKILEPEYWSGIFENYLLLFALIFTELDIFRLPICKNNKVFFQYYMICKTKKSYCMDVLYRKLSYAYNNNNNIIITTQIENITEWKSRLNNIAESFKLICNPVDSLQDIIQSLFI